MELRVKFSGRILQFLGAILLNLHTMVFSMAVTWTSPALPLLLSEDSPLPSGKISIGDANLISSLPYFGGIAGSIIYEIVAKRYGQKWPIVFASIPEIAAAFCIVFAQDVKYILVARFLSGLGGGCLQLVVAYVCEVSEDSVRGSLGSILGIIDTAGVLLGAIVGAYLPFFYAPFVSILLSAVSLLFIFFPQSPQFLLLRKKIPEAKQSLDFYRQNVPKEKVDEEFNLLKDSIVTAKEEVTATDFKNASTIKALIICFVIFTGRQASGVAIFLNFNALLFKETGMELDPNVGFVIYASVQLVCDFLTAMYIDKFGRRIQIIGSLVGTFISYIPIAAYFYTQNAGLDVSSFSGWVPLLAFSGVAVFSVGIIHTPMVVMGEIVPAKLRGTIALISYFVIRFQCLFMMHFFLPFINQFGLHNCIVGFSIWTLFEAIFIYFYLPETKGRSIDDIVKTLTDRRSANLDKAECE